MSHWQKVVEDSYPGHKEKKFGKKHKSLVTNILANLETYLTLLQSGEHPEQLKRLLSFVHEEKNGLYAIDQRPPVKGFQLRLYVYPEVESSKLHVLIIGDKKSQSGDIKIAHKVIKELQDG